MLGNRPRIGPIPAELVFPWAIIVFASYLIRQTFSLPWLWTCILATWGMAVWWILTGDRPWIFLSKFIGTPTLDRGYPKVQPILPASKGQRERNGKKTSKQARRNGKS
jgi:hypothetical protein